MDFETATSRSRKHRGSGPRPATNRHEHVSVPELFRFYRPQAVVIFMVLAVLAGGAFYASRASESAPRVVYSFALDEAEADAEQSLLIDINTADAERLQELPGVGPATAEAIMDYRQRNGPFGSVEELDDVSGIGPATLAEIAPLATV